MEIFIVDERNGGIKPLVFQYNDQKLYEKMLPVFKKAEREGKIKILDIRKNIYTVKN